MKSRRWLSLGVLTLVLIVWGVRFCASRRRSQSVAAQIMLKCQQAYDEITSYRGTTVVHFLSRFSSPETTQARIVFKRPNKICIEATDATGDPVLIISDGREVWIRWPVYGRVDGEETRRKKESIARVISGFSGPTRGATFTIPAILLKVRGSDIVWGAWKGKRFLEFHAGGAKIEGKERVLGKVCYRIVSRESADRLTIFWIDTKTFLLVQMREEGKTPKGRPYIDTETFRIERLNMALDDQLFHRE